jgi:hypothetical protein
MQAKANSMTERRRRLGGFAFNYRTKNAQNCSKSAEKDAKIIKKCLILALNFLR